MKQFNKMPKNVGDAKLVISTYESLEEEGFDKADADSFYNTDGNLDKAFSYETEDEDTGAMVGVLTTDGKYSVYGAGKDEEDITFEHMVEVLVLDAQSINA